MKKYTLIAPCVALLMTAGGTEALAQAGGPGTSPAPGVRDFPDMTTDDCNRLASRQGEYDTADLTSRMEYCDRISGDADIVIENPNPIPETAVPGEMGSPVDVDPGLTPNNTDTGNQPLDPVGH